MKGKGKSEEKKKTHTQKSREEGRFDKKGGAKNRRGRWRRRELAEE